jgi:hypothetical protein
MAEEIVQGYRATALDAMKRASELLCAAQDTGLDDDLRKAMLAHENAALEARHYFYVKHTAQIGAVKPFPNGNRLRMPEQLRSA